MIWSRFDTTSSTEIIQKNFEHSDYSLRVVNKENIWGDDSSFRKPTSYTSTD